MTVKIVTDSTADLPPDLAESLGSSVIPLNVHFGTDVFKDGIDIKPDEFYQRLTSGAQLPTTSQPNVGEFLSLYNDLAKSNEEIVSVHISDKLSGTLNSARQANDQYEVNTRIETVDSKHGSMGLGLIAVHASKVAKNGGSVDDVVNVPEGGSAYATARITIDSNAESNGDGVFVDVVAKIGDLQHNVTFKVKIESNPLSIHLAISPNTARVFQPTVITATVTDAAGNPVDSASVTFNRLGGNGTFADGGTFTTLTTGSNGIVSATFTPKSKETLSIRVSAETVNYVSVELTTQIPVKGDFVLSITPTQEQINAGDSKAVTVTITSTDGFSSPVELLYEDVVVGFTVSFSESNIIVSLN